MRFPSEHVPHETVATREAATSPSACQQFFSVDELVSLFLHSADALVLLNCQRTCRLWKEIIDDSPQIQRNLFLLPDTELRVPAINPVLSQWFTPLFGPQERHHILFTAPTDEQQRPKSILRTNKCKYSDLLTLLPWARDAQSQEAYTREEASWRNMLLSQPPIIQLHHWHRWESSVLRNPQPSSAAADDDDEPLNWDETHNETFTSCVTIGELWDFVEPRLLRGCEIQVAFFLRGGSAMDDPSALDFEREYEGVLSSPVRGRGVYDLDVARVSVRSRLVWRNEGRRKWNRFRILDGGKGGGVWEVVGKLPKGLSSKDSEDERYRHGDGDGALWLEVDCKRDWEGREAVGRWSMSERFERVFMRDGGAGRGRLRHLRRWCGA